MTTPEERDYIGEVIAEDAAARCQPILTLAESLRQYRHNNAEGFVAAYEYDGTRKAFNELRQQLADVSHERDLLRAAQGWIKCGDRLPDDAKGDYLIVCESGEVALSEYIFDEEEGWGFWYDPEATHWMPLPAAPSAEVKS